jgi:dipeptidyl-peptidase-4
MKLFTKCPITSAIALTAVVALPAALHAQDRLKTYPGYDQYVKMSPQYAGLVTGGVSNIKWMDDAKGFTYVQAGKSYRYDIAKKMSEESGLPVPVPGGLGRQGGVRNAVGGQGQRERGRQYEIVISPDTQLTALYKNRNVYVKGKDGVEHAITTKGDEKARTKYGSASWVYGEELDVTDAMWWSPDSKRLAYYGFDDTPVPDYYLQLDQTKLYSKIDTEAYPKVGYDNPIVTLFVHDMTTGKDTEIDVRSGKPFENGTLGYYVYDVRWSEDGREITFNRTNRRQNIIEYMACNPASGACRVVVHDEWLPSWIENHPTVRYLSDNNRFIFESPRGDGFANYYLYDFKAGKLLNAITSLKTAEVAGIVSVDEKANVMYYMAHDGDNYMKLQLHRVSLNGTGDVRLTDPTLNHSITLAPNGSYFVDVAQTHNMPPVVRVLDKNGRVLSEVAKADASKMKTLGIQPPELFTYTSADGQTVLHGLLSKPSNFDPSKKYPVLFSVYGGPDTNGAREVFSAPSVMTEYGFLMVTLDTRSAAGRGKKLTDAIYQSLGVPEIDDFAAASKELAKRPYVDGGRVGIFGTSYGGYSSAMALLRHPEAFAAASASSPVTSWYHYDTIYTERYMWLPQENKKGYDAGSAMTYAPNLKGALMLYYGTADNNVHPNNMMQLITALQKAGKHFEVQVGPDAGHSGINNQRMLEFFIENLVMRPMTGVTTF